MKVILVLCALFRLIFAQSYAGTYKSACYNPAPGSTPEYVIIALTLGATSYQMTINAYSTSTCANNLATFVLSGTYSLTAATETIYTLSSQGTAPISGVFNMDVTWNSGTNGFTAIAHGTGIGALVTSACNGTENLFPGTIPDNTLTDITQLGCLGLGIPPVISIPTEGINGLIFYDLLKVSGNIVMTGYNPQNLNTPSFADRSDVLDDTFTLQTTATPTPSSSDAGAIAGGVIGGTAGVALLATLGLFLYRRARAFNPEKSGFEKEKS